MESMCFYEYCKVGELSMMWILMRTFLILLISCVAWCRSTNYVLSVGLFGFAGGITNWLAIKMLFDRIPGTRPGCEIRSCIYTCSMSTIWLHIHIYAVVGLTGSGVIPRRFKEIRNTVKSEPIYQP